MTGDELSRDLVRFQEYLAANGEAILCGMITTEDAAGNRKTVQIGPPEWRAMSMAMITMEANGYEIARKR